MADIAGERPDPDALLKTLDDAARQAVRGKLRVYFGSSAGVGKTYAMLVAARAQAAQGVSVLAGIVETHGRRETASLLEGLAVLPLKDVAYRGHMLKEFDLDGALAARPGLVLVDELAHSNAPRFPPRQALAGHPGIAVGRHRRLDHAERAASGQPERSGGQHHRRARLGDRARRGLRRRRRSHPGGPVGRRTAAAIEGRQGLPARTGPPRHPQFLPQGQPDRLARTGAAPHRRPRRRRRPGLSARPRDRTRLAHPAKPWSPASVRTSTPNT